MFTPNEIIQYETFAEIILTNRLGFETARTLISLDKIDMIKKYKWHLGTDNYVITKQNNKTIRLHRLLLNAQIGEYVDHVNRNPLDNRNENIRICTGKENSLNRSPNISKKTGNVIGVAFRKVGNWERWMARIRVNGELLNLGYFKEYDNAIKARLSAEKQYFGEFAPQKHLFEQYGIG